MRKTSDSTKVKTGKHEPAEHSVTQPVVCSRNINHKMLIQKRGWPVGSCKPRSERRLWTASPGSPNYPHSRRMCKRANALRIDPTVPLPHWLSKSVNSARNRRFAYTRGKPGCDLFQFRPLVAYQQAVATSATGRVCWTKAASINDRDRGRPCGPTPPTPPCVRVRTRRLVRSCGCSSDHARRYLPLSVGPRLRSRLFSDAASRRSPLRFTCSTHSSG